MVDQDGLGVTPQESEEPEDHDWILVVGEGETFSSKLVEYALWFAKRLGYGILALNSATFAQDAPGARSPYQDDTLKDFKESSAKRAELIAQLAAADGIPFQHLMWSGSQDHGIRAAFKRFKRLEYVLTEPDIHPGGEEEEGIPIFTYSS